MTGIDPSTLEVPVRELAGLSFFEGFPEEALRPIAAAASYRDFEPNAVVVHQNDRASAFFFLLSGAVQFLTHVEGMDDLLVGVERDAGILVGWGAFREPYRYTATVRSEQACRMLRIPGTAFDGFADREPQLALRFLGRVASTVATRLEEARRRLVAGAKRHEAAPEAKTRQHDDGDGRAERPPLGTEVSALELFQSSPFFEGLETVHLERLAQLARRRGFEPGARLFSQGERAREFMLLADGAIGLSYGDENGASVMMRAVAERGEPLGWSALVEPKSYRATATALGPTEVFAIGDEELERYCTETPGFGILLMRRMLRLIGNRLRITRIRLVAQRYSKEALAVRAMIDASAASLHVTSPLFKIPYLLENRLTVSDAFHSLELLRAHGNPLERGLAALALEILDDVHKELEVYQALQRIYETVANAPPDASPETIRRECLEAFRKLFDRTRHVIRGEENLPERGGNIVIMNHLENDMDNLLPNDFRLTLDTHFVSAMVLLPKYGEPPIRVIRKPLPGWYGFQQYYDRLGYIYVYSGHVDEEDRDRHITRRDRQRYFLEAAAEHLKAGRNVVICPEGACHYTEDSPHPFKPGAFRLAAYVRPEPLILPIAVANFDRKITRTRTAAVVHPPFRLSDFVPDPVEDTALFDFLRDYSARYRDYVREAASLARESRPKRKPPT